MLEFFSPKSVAIIGASNDVTKLGGMLVKNMLDAGYKGKLCPINPKGGEIQGLKAYTNVKEIGEPVDLAVAAVKNTLGLQTPRPRAPPAIQQLSILSAGS